MPPPSTLALAPAGHPAGGSSDDPAPPPSWHLLLTVLERVAVSLTDIAATLRAHNETSTERHDTILREVARIQRDLEAIRLAPVDLVATRQRADEEASLARVRGEAEAEAHEAIRAAQERAAKAEAHALALEGKLSAAKARGGAVAAIWGAVRDAAKALGSWARSTTGAGMIGAAAASLLGWLLHRLGVTP